MIGTRFQGQIRDISIEGYGVLDHPDKRVFFVLGVFPGDEIQAEVVHLKERYGYAKLVALIHPSPDRVHPPCPHTGLQERQCGGCPWMSLNYSKQLEYKHHMLKHALTRAQLWSRDRELPPIWASEFTLGFRNRAQFKTDGEILGFVSRFSKVIAPIKDCLILNNSLRQTLQLMIKKLPAPQWQPTPPHSWSYLEIDDEMKANEVIPNRRRPFRQANGTQNQRMQTWVKTQTQAWQDHTVLELFCGSGNFTKILMENKPRELSAVDVASDGLTELRQGSLGTSCRIVEANLFKPSDWKRIELRFPDFLFLDPPREGFNKLDLFVSQRGFPKEIIYISCSLSSFVEDLGRLKKKGYALRELMGLDQFPHTPHIELLAVIEKK